MVFSLGAVLAPIVSQTIYTAYGLSGVFFILGGVALCWAVYSAFAFRNKMRTKFVVEKISLKQRLNATVQVLRKPGIKQIFFISIMITSWQLSAIYYLSTYFSSLSTNSIDGAIALSVFFLGMMVSRLLYARIADRYPQGWVFLFSNLLGMLTWLAVFIVPSIQVKMILVALSAMLCANNFPIAFSCACRLAPKNSAAASGFVTLGYYIAIFAFIPIIGSIGDAIGLSNALVFAAIPLLFIVFASFFLHKQMKSKKI
jgi:predicted MFS family arabinose efflux permease